MTELGAKDLMWREWTARRVLAGDASAKASELIRKPWPHTAAEFWTADQRYSTPMNAGWLYFDNRAILFIGDDPIYSVTDRPLTNDDRLLHLLYSQLGSAQVAKAHTRGERLLKFGDGTVFLLPKRFAKHIATLANR